jgi:hypothetical protein
MCSSVEGNTWCPVLGPAPGPAPAPVWSSSVTIGDGRQGTTTFAVAQWYQGSAYQTIDAYFHLRMPENFDRNVDESHMFHVTVTGYNFQAGTPIDLVFVGYSYRESASQPLYHKSVVDRAGGKSCTNNSMSYWGSDKHLYLRFKVFAVGGKIGVANTYYSSFRVDSMYVGNGIIMKQGDISVIVSEQPEL